MRSGVRATIAGVSVFSLDDLYTAGIGFDLAGAWLLGRGLLPSLPDLRQRSTVGGFENADVDAVADRADATMGFVALGVGFVLQAAGYVLSLLDVDVTTGSSAAAVAMGLCLLTLATSLAVARPLRRLILHRTLARLACVGYDGQPQSRDVEWLRAKGQALDIPAIVHTDGTPESDADYCVRVFGSE